MPHQIAITVRAPICPEQRASLDTVLRSLDHEVVRRQLFPFESLPVHFARLVVIDDALDLEGTPIAASLVFLCDIDSPENHYWSRLAVEAQDGLDHVFSCCEGYPATPTTRGRIDFLHRMTIRTTTAYVNTVGMSVDEVHEEAQLRNAIAEYLDRSAWSRRTASELRSSVRQFVSDDPSLRWALSPPAKPEFTWRVREAIHMVGTA